ncbi:PulJ/GspJ family protein [Alkalibacillus haloalkaliphilus]|uniref:PulJ/GspJ family protein n=1 Tax=Alkalibacillus haloalkaliphilus TaxID=94136 RepID=UPI00031CBFE6|nr:prepilin-type N-terminal cleavage/methylation domain-containing protein [Alkalibacillus haloalkaliphilus]
MINKYFKSENGVTLIELLASLVLISIISLLAFSVLNNTFQYSETSNSHIELRQDSNFIITQIRQQHQEISEDYTFCLEDIQRKEEHSFSHLVMNELDLYDEQCATFAHENPLNVDFTLKNEHNHEYQINTTIDPQVNREQEKNVQLSLSSTVDDFYSFIKNENVFIFSSNISINGSADITGNQNGKIIINNNETDLDFSTADQISTENIFIDKAGQEVNLITSTSLGENGVTEIINIIGDVNLNNGGATINSEEVIIDGNVTFNSSSIINATNVYISSDVIFNNWSGNINADNIYIGGDINSRNPEHELLRTGEFNEEQLLSHPTNNIPPLKEDHWFYENGYETTLNLNSESKIFSPSDLNIHVGNNDPENFIIASKGNVSIDSNWSQLDGVIIAPNGKVTFNGNSFTGVVISRDGFDVPNGGSSINFRNIEEYITSDNLPFDQ